MFLFHIRTAFRVGVIICSVLFFNGTAEAAQPLSVTVTNGMTNPVPVVTEGTTAISGNVNVTNQPTVGLTPGTNVRDTDQPALQPLQKRHVIFLAAGGIITETITTVPAGKRFVIEFVTVDVAVSTGQKGFVTILTTVGTDVVGHVLTTALQESALSIDIFRATQATRIYADPNTDVNMVCGIAAAVAGQCSVSISGYLVNLP